MSLGASQGASIGDTYFSYSARTFRDPGTTSRDPLIADLIPQGLCGAGGYVSESKIVMATSPNILFDRYTKGYNMAESFYAACPDLFWKTVIIGDPLMAAYATPPSVSLSIPGPKLSGKVAVTAVVSDQRGVSQVEFYLDDELIGVVKQQPFTMQLDTTTRPIGAHTLEAIAYEDSAVATQGSCKVAVTVDNPISVEKSIRDVFFHLDGQLVRLTDKVVTAGTQEIGGGFYIEETDRSCGMKVTSSQNVSREDVVTVVGAATSTLGDRTIDASSVIVQSSNAALPRPVMVRLRDLGGGARNVSMLVRTVGRVSSPGVGEFYIDDGSGGEPVKVICPGVSSPGLGKLVAVTGLSVIEYASPICRAAVRARDYRDIQPLN